MSEEILEKLNDPKSVPPETSRKVRHSIKVGDHSLDAADAKLEFMEGQLQDMNRSFTTIEKCRSGEWSAVRPEQASQP